MNGVDSWAAAHSWTAEGEQEKKEGKEVERGGRARREEENEVEGILIRK